VQKAGVIRNLQEDLDKLRNDDAEDELKGHVERVFKKWKTSCENRGKWKTSWRPRDVFIAMLETVSTEFKHELGFEPKSKYCTELAKALSPSVSGKMSKLKRLYKQVQRALHPDRNGGNAEMANMIFKEFESQWEEFT